MISRAIVVYGGSIILRIARVHIPLQWQNILTLGGLRGGIAVALVLSLPLEYEFKNLFIGLIISVVAVNLVVNPILLDRYLTRSKMTSANVDTLGKLKEPCRGSYYRQASVTLGLVSRNKEGGYRLPDRCRYHLCISCCCIRNLLTVTMDFATRPMKRIVSSHEPHLIAWSKAILERI